MCLRGDPIAVGLSVEPRDQPGRPAAVAFIGGAEFRVEQRFLGADARNQRDQVERGQDKANAGAECKRLAESADQQAKIAGVANEAVGPLVTSACPGWIATSPLNR